MAVASLDSNDRLFPMRSSSIFSRSLILLQLGSAALLLFKAPLLVGPWPVTIFQLAGIGVGVWAVQVMRTANRFSIPPEVLSDSKLVRRSIYKYVRHPMYTSVLLYFLPSLLFHFSWWRSGFFAVLLVTLIVKLHYEEKLLRSAFPDYGDYQKKSWHLLPLVY